jgi:hypothetical protein
VLHSHILERKLGVLLRRVCHIAHSMLSRRHQKVMKGLLAEREVMTRFGTRKLGARYPEAGTGWPNPIPSCSRPPGVYAIGARAVGRDRVWKGTSIGH